MDNRTQKGLILKQARESKGLDLQTVHEATKIPLDALKAIEEGYTVRTLSTFYYRGFLKMYAQFLGIEIGTVVDDYHAPKESEFATRLHQQGPLFQKKLPSLPAGQAGQPAVKIDSEILRKIAVIAGLVIALVLVFRLIGFAFHKIFNRSEQVTTHETTSFKEKGKKKVPLALAGKKKGAAEGTSHEKSQTTKEGAASFASLPERKTSSTSSKTASISARAKKDSWLQVKVDGATVFRSVLRKGGVETWNGKDTIEVSGRNIGELEFEINGKMVGSLLKQDRRAKKVVVTPDGFVVKE